MFWHNFKNDLKCCFREKSFLFWLILFPILLSTFFHMTMSDIYETDTIFETIPTAVVENKENPAFKEVLISVTSGEDALMSAEFTDEQTALQKLEDGDIEGIIYVDEKISLKISPKGSSMKQTILREFLDTYRINEAVIIDTMQNNPQNLEKVMSTLTAEIECNENIPLTEGNMDPYISFFYNAIAMVAFFGSETGLHIAISNQANLSSIAARKCISPNNKFITILSNVCASCVSQIVCVVISISYIIFVLGKDLGDQTGMIYLSGAIGSITGVSFGFFIGSLGRLSEGVKGAIAMSVTMGCCFLSGLMMGDMKIIVENNFPWFNRINPAALISDMFYCLNVYNDYSLYTEKAVTLLILSAVFVTGGFLLTRRKKYASL